MTAISPHTVHTKISGKLADAVRKIVAEEGMSWPELVRIALRSEVARRASIEDDDPFRLAAVGNVQAMRHLAQNGLAAALGEFEAANFLNGREALGVAIVLARLAAYSGQVVDQVRLADLLIFRSDTAKLEGQPDFADILGGDALAILDRAASNGSEEAGAALLKAALGMTAAAVEMAKESPLAVDAAR